MPTLNIRIMALNVNYFNKNLIFFAWKPLFGSFGLILLTFRFKKPKKTML